jgi:spore coat protein CotF
MGMNKRDFYAKFVRNNKGINTEYIYSFDFPENPKLEAILKKRLRSKINNLGKINDTRRKKTQISRTY